MANVDCAWLRMDDPTNLMMITSVLIFEEPITREQVKQVVRERVLHLNRFRQRATLPHASLGAPYWEEDPHLDLDEHIRRAHLPPPGDQAALQELVSQLMSVPLNPARPPWQYHLVEDYQGGSALIVRLHHCIADGIELTKVLLSMTDARREGAAASAQPARSRRQRRGRLASALRTARHLSDEIVHDALVTVRDPGRVVDLARLGAGSVMRLAQILVRMPDPHTAFKGPLGVDKRAAWSRRLPLSDVKAVCAVTGGTINDVLLTAVAGGLRDYLLHRGQPVDGLSFHAVVPVNLRPLDGPITLGNKFGLVFLKLPLGIADPVERLEAVRQHMNELKHSPEAPAIFGLLNVVGKGPVELENLLVTIFGTKATGVMTNVPGPRQQLYFAGAPLSDIMFWVPQSGRLGLGVSIISYNGQVLVGVATDVGLVPDPETIVAGFENSFGGMMELVTQLHDDGELPAVAGSPPVTRCQATTRQGQRCRNRARPGSAYCRVHAP
jgi:WS/DGAT/MGAT family acyltransferase